MSIRRAAPNAGGLRFVAALAACLFLGVSVLQAAGNDNNVEWFGIFSDPYARKPLHPKRGQSFTVELRTLRGDITSASVRTWDGAERLFPMFWVRNEGPFDVWRAVVGGSRSDFLYWRFRITDGSDTDCYNFMGMWSDPPPRGDFLLNTTELGAYPLGATPTPEGVVFRVWAPNAQAASVAGTFNGWSTTRNPMRSIEGYWQVRVPEARPGDRYKFVFRAAGRTLWRTDPRCRRQESSVGNSIVVDPSFNWTDEAWETPPLDDLIVYELHVGTFSGEGDGGGNYPGTFRDVVDKHLGDLVELGITAVELMPVCEFAGDRSWGYNPAFIYAPESAYGTPDDLKYLVDKFHGAGIAVLLDVVYNHLGASDLEGNLLQYDGTELYFYPTGSPFRETPWGPRPNYGSPGVKEFLLDNIRYWLEEFHFDGFRLDGTDFIKVNSEGWQLLVDITRTVDAVSPQAVVLAEQLPNDPAVTEPVLSGGAGVDAQWNDAFHDNLRQAVREAAFEDPDMNAVAAGINHFGLRGVVNYIESHDEAHVFGRICVEADPADPESVWAQGRSRVAAALVLFSAGVPMLLAGEEFLESRPFGDGPENRIRWQLKERHRGFYKFVKDAITLRRSQPALRASAHQNVFHVNDSDNVLALHRWTDAGQDIVVVVSLSNRDFQSYELGFPRPGIWYELLNGESELYGGRNLGNAGLVNASGPPLHGFAQSAAIVLPRMGVLVFGKEKPQPIGGFIRGDCNGDEAVDVGDAIHALGVLFAGAASDCRAACDSNSDGALDIADAVYLLSFLFAGGRPPPAPYPACGTVQSALPCSRMCR